MQLSFVIVHAFNQTLFDFTTVQNPINRYNYKFSMKSGNPLKMCLAISRCRYAYHNCILSFRTCNDAYNSSMVSCDSAED